ncbi:hypothetical protein [Lacrimispora sp.]|uniref:hypothetical protein n=1 Tax=Lacrimispora sp. TaxID=2719234 RepID=UPI0029E74C11|nr:hypothetical protein [Lacrimispora sp.]
MNFLKKNSARLESCKKRIPVWAAAAVVAVIVLAAAGWHYIPIYYARFYLDRSALQTQGILKELWGSEKGEGDAYEDSFKLVAGEALVNGKPVLVLPGGLGISLTKQRDLKNTFAQGKFDVYFLGAVQEGAQYWADADRVVIRVPQISAALVKTTQTDVKAQLGVSPLPQQNENFGNKFGILMDHIRDMIKKSRVEFTERDENGAAIRALVPAEQFDSVLQETGALFEEGPGEELKSWAKFLEERKTEGDTQEILISIRKDLSISQVIIPELAYAGFQRVENQGVLLSGHVTGPDREINFDTTVYFDNSSKEKRSLQIKELNIGYNKKNLSLKVKLSGGYEGGRIPAGVLDHEKLSTQGEATVSLSELKEKFLEMINFLGIEAK